MEHEIFRFDSPLGRVERTPKPTDYPASVLLGKGTATPPIWRPADAGNIPITMQDKQPACGGYSGQYSLVLYLYRQLVALGQIPSYLPLSPRAAYALEKTVDGLGIEVQGTDIEAVAKMRVLLGICLEAMFGSDTSLALDVFDNWQLASAEAKADALSRATGESYFFLGKAPTFQSIKDAIFNYGDAILEVQVGEEWYTSQYGKVIPVGQTSWAADDILPLVPPKNIIDGHFIDATMFEAASIYGPNSWSEQWGLKGWFELQENYMPFVVNGVFFHKIAPSVKQALSTQQLSHAQQIIQDIEEALGLIRREMAQALPKVENP
jgi:hypothetical protein